MGVGLGVALGLRGVTCVVVERRTELSRIPEGQGLSQRTMEHFWSWGLADELRAARAMPSEHPFGQVTVYGSLLGEHWHAPPARELVQPYYFQRNERLPQYATEQVLRRRMAGLASVESRFGWTATGLAQDADGVRVVVDRDGVQEVLEADYVVGCDGGHSRVREQADIARSATDFEELVALVVFRAPELHEALRRFPDRSTYRVLPPDLKGSWMVFGRVDVGEQFFFHAPVPRGTTPAAFDPRRCCTAPPGSRSRSRSSPSASGTCVSRWPTSTGPDAPSSRGTRRTRTRRTAASASTTASRTP